MKRKTKFLASLVLLFGLAGCSLSIKVNDQTEPVIKGTKDWTMNQFDEIPNLLEGVTATDDVDGDVTVKVDTSKVKTDVVGTYEVIVHAKDKAGNQASVTIKLTVLDKTAPVLSGYQEEYVVEVDGELPDLQSSVKAMDAVDGEVEVTIDTSKVDLSTAGRYEVTLKAVDEAGNKVEEIIYIVVTEESLENTAPIIKGAKDITIEKGTELTDEFFLQGVSASDKKDGVVEVHVDYSEVNVNEVGRYTVTYTATNSAGKTDTVRINVTVKEKKEIDTTIELGTIGLFEFDIYDVQIRYYSNYIEFILLDEETNPIGHQYIEYTEDSYGETFEFLDPFGGITEPLLSITLIDEHLSITKPNETDGTAYLVSALGEEKVFEKYVMEGLNTIEILFTEIEIVFIPNNDEDQKVVVELEFVDGYVAAEDVFEYEGNDYVYYYEGDESDSIILILVEVAEIDGEAVTTEIFNLFSLEIL